MSAKKLRNRFPGRTLAFVALCLSACGGTDAPAELTYDQACALVPGCSEPRFDVTRSTEALYRVIVVRGASGDIRIDHVERVNVPQGDGVPFGRLTGSHLLVGLDAQGASVDGQLVSFPESIEVSVEDAFDHVHVDLTGVEVDAIGYVRALPGVEELGVVDASGELLVRVPAVATQEKLTQASSHCSHIRLLEGEADRRFARGMSSYDSTELIVPGPTQRAVIEGAFAQMTPLLCHAVSRIAVGHIDDAPGVGGVVAQLSAGDLVLMNVGAGYREEELAASEEQRLRMMHTIVHETAHTLEALLNSEGVGLQHFEGDWPVASRSVASTTVDHVRVRWGMNNEWRRTHFSFRDLGFALPYPTTSGEISAVRRWEAEQTAESGFMSRYGASQFEEDIAEMVTWTYMAPHFRAAGIPNGRRQTEDFACQIMREHDERSVPGRLSAAYTKLMFLSDLGAVHPDDVEACKGPNLGLPLDGPGFHVWQEQIRLRSFERGITAAIGQTTGGAQVFEMNGEGEAAFGDDMYPATFRLQLDLTQSVPGAEVQRIFDNPPWPRGIYPLALTGNNKFELRLDGAAAGNFDVSEGFVLVAEASNDRIAGSVFITQVWRLSAPIPVPEVYDPPLTVRFLIEN